LVGRWQLAFGRSPLAFGKAITKCWQKFVFTHFCIQTLQTLIKRLSNPQTFKHSSIDLPVSQIRIKTKGTGIIYPGDKKPKISWWLEETFIVLHTANKIKALGSCMQL
jgi:hypothetical protein